MNVATTQTRGIFYSIASGSCYGLLGYFGISIIRGGGSVYNMTFWRFVVASLCIAIILPFTKPTGAMRTQFLKTVFIAGTIYCLEAVAYFISGNAIGTGLAMVLFFTYPAIVVLINLLLYNKRVDRSYYFAIGIILVGMILLADIGGMSLNLYGVSFAIVSAALYAVYIVISKNNPMPPILSTFAVSIGCMLTALVLALLDGSFFVPIGTVVWANIFGIGIICTAIPILLLLESMKYISSEQASIFSVSEPLFIILFGVVLLGEIITIKQSIGIALLLSGALVTLLPKKTKK